MSNNYAIKGYMTTINHYSNTGHYSEIVNTTRSMGDSHIDHQKQIIINAVNQSGNNKIKSMSQSTVQQDQRQGIDLIVTDTTDHIYHWGLRSRTWTNQSNPKWLNEITIRCDLISSNGIKIATEIDKIKSGANVLDYYLYSWFEQNGNHKQSVIVDMAKLKASLSSKDMSMINDVTYFDNLDGSKGMAIKLNPDWVIQVIRVTGCEVEI